jgi:predicted ATPase/class 3 adenylate cyclase
MGPDEPGATRDVDAHRQDDDLVRELPTGTVTFLFTDIEGSTRLLRELGDRYADALAEHRRALRDAFARHNGVEVDTQGDAFFVAFERADDALAAAEEAQRALEVGLVRIRIGIHSGEPAVTKEGYVGLDVHRAARICSTAHGGQTVMSANTHALLDQEVELRDLGLHRLKDLAEPVRLYQLGDGDFPPLRSLNATNLPAQPTPLVGRERELADLLVLVRDSRMVTLTGAGGSGKTRLALQAAAELVDDFPDGVFWASLATVADPKLVLSTIEQTLGAKVPLSEHVDEKRILLLLDNLEQVIDCAPSLSEVLSACPNLHLLVTSREPLRIGGERDYAVEPLPEKDAVTLFRERAVRAEPLEAVREICRRLDGLPLAIELAAARTRLLRPDQLLERLQRALPILTRGRRDAPERQRTLRATIEWSYDLLDAAEQRLFRGLSVFAGSFGLEAAERVCDADLETLESLLEKNLVRRWASGRLGMLETIREFAAERLEQEGEAATLARRHADFFLREAEAWAPQLSSPEQHDAMAGLSAENENLLVALDWCIRTGAAEEAFRLIGSLDFFWLVSGGASAARSLAQRVLPLEGATSVANRARGMLALGRLLQPVDPDQALTLTEQSQELYETLGDHEGAFRCLFARVFLEMEGDRFERAGELAHEARERSVELGDRASEGLAANVLGILARRRGDLEAAEGLYEVAVGCARETGIASLISGVMTNLAWARWSRGKTHQARTEAEEALKLARAVPHKAHIASTLELLAWLDAQCGDYARAASRFSDGLRLHREVEDPACAADCLEGLGVVAALRPLDRALGARLLGAAGADPDHHRHLDPPPEQLVQLVDDALEACRASLGGEAFASQLEAGSNLSLDAASELAWSVLGESDSSGID